MDAITVKSIDDIAPYSGPHEIPGIRCRPVREALGVSAWGMNVIELDPHCTGCPEHDHATDRQEEVYVVLRGSVVIRTDGAERTLSQGDLVRVAPEVRRKLVTGAEGVVVLALGGTPGEPYKPSLGG